YSGFIPSYEFTDAKLSELFQRVVGSFPKSSVHYVSSTKNNKLIIVRVSGNDAPGTYYLFDSDNVKLTTLASRYSVPAIAEIKAFKYNARDGLKIPALITMPPGAKGKKNLPLIALPHGGPEAYDQIGFDWMAQYFALKGYIVLQPNFRGSKGFGYDFRDAGRGRWGREMQDDVSDGVGVLVKAGYVDPKRVCIIGGSYGGYSALAGGAFSPELYRCVISVNGVSDLPLMLKNKKSRYGNDHWVINYWHEVIGDSNAEIDKLRDISPINFASQFQAPVLLIHGKDDLIVPFRQSAHMYEALKKAGKSVELATLKGEDHWLSTSATRLEMLKAIDRFLDTHNPADAVVNKKIIGVTNTAAP
ncbi:MAG: dipeptidyl aminopeptidase/acylaminoacyl peptidase, partial [Pseudohongiellaceae bacterium]